MNQQFTLDIAQSLPHGVLLKFSIKKMMANSTKSADLLTRYEQRGNWRAAAFASNKSSGCFPMKINRIVLGVAAVLAWAGAAAPSLQNAALGAAAESAPALTVGSPAPNLSADKWVKGAPVRTFEKGRVYVVEFWATWCTPCIASVPHLTELQKKYPNITIIGMAASEQPTRSNLDDRQSKVESFVLKQGAQMNYTVAYDGAGSMWSNWMVPAQRGGIPATFIIGPDGRIAWIGHPLLDEFEKELDSVVARPDVRKDPSNWQAAATKPTQTTILAPGLQPTPAPKLAAATADPKASKSAPKPSAAGKKIATGPKNDDSSPK